MKYTFLIVSSLLLCSISLRNCLASKSRVEKQSDLNEDFFFERLKKEKEVLMKQFEIQLTRLEQQRDSLQGIINKNKNELKVQRLKTKILFQRVIKAVEDSCGADSLQPLVQSYIEAQDQNDTQCDSTIYSLENMVANRDSTLAFQRLMSESQKQILEDQELRNKQLTDQLNTAYKMQKKKSRQNKILAGGIMIISGITTSILILTKSL